MKGVGSDLTDEMVILGWRKRRKREMRWNQEDAGRCFDPLLSDGS